MFIRDPLGVKRSVRVHADSEQPCHIPSMNGRSLLHTPCCNGQPGTLGSVVRGDAKVHGSKWWQQQGESRHLPDQAGSRKDARTHGHTGSQAFIRPALRDSGAPRAEPPLGSPARARRRTRILGAPQRAPRDPGEESPRCAHRGPSPRIRDIPGRDPTGRVRRWADDDLGFRSVRRGEVVGLRGQVRAPRHEGHGKLRALPDQGPRLDDPSARPLDPIRRLSHLRQAHACRCREAPGRQRGLGVRNQVGRSPRDPLRRRRAGAGPQPERSRRDRVVPGVGRHREVPRHDHLRHRRRDRGAGRGRPAKLFQAAATHARVEPARGQAAGRSRIPSRSWPSTCSISTGIRCSTTTYDERRERLESLHLSGETFITTDAFRDVSGQDILAATIANGLEGVVAKRRSSPYRPGRRIPTGRRSSPSGPRRSSSVAGPTGRASGGTAWAPSSSGSPDEGGLRYVGKVGTGFSAQARRRPARRPRAPGHGGQPVRLPAPGRRCENGPLRPTRAGGGGRVRRVDHGRTAAPTHMARACVPTRNPTRW